MNQHLEIPQEEVGDGIEAGRGKGEGGAGQGSSHGSRAASRWLFSQFIPNFSGWTHFCKVKSSSGLGTSLRASNKQNKPLEDG